MLGIVHDFNFVRYGADATDGEVEECAFEKMVD